uniref:MRG domain-containing protein n=2 Tax=Trichobilharzia regenti TaxID=157069 RepID=A0AA85JHP7_TRIRE|nr:unnamed protein product [Trichobilharzia regenti]
MAVDKTDSYEWTCESEIQLFRGLIKHKPVGVFRHFQMMCLCNFLNSVLREPVTPDIIWRKLDTLYNMEELHESEVNPFQGKMREFSLSEEFDSLKELEFPRVAPRSDTATPKSSVVDTSNRKRTRKSVRWADVLTTSDNMVQTPTTSTVTTDAGVGSSSRKRRR